MSLRNTFYYMIIVVPAQTVLALFLAFLINQKFLRGRGGFRTLLYFPSVTSSIAITLIWIVLFAKSGIVNRLLPVADINWFNEPNGIIHNALGVFGVDRPPSFMQHKVFELTLWQWISGPSVALFAIMLLTIWTTSGGLMVMFLGGLQNVPTEVEESCCRRWCHLVPALPAGGGADAQATDLPGRHARGDRDMAGLRPDLRQRRRP